VFQEQTKAKQESVREPVKASVRSVIEFQQGWDGGDLIRCRGESCDG